ncbi:putative CRM domain-containing protein [Apostasia shenzhenica]|uniref:Putative CRM domain-containing protein n=1 Tax=Apostasia shenzhenica TaxID=1088818 RepID=A0A2H9ZTU5_9ASPA|nr:putative CRM domain-containing protein [Apostasia shenzhenica]
MGTELLSDVNGAPKLQRKKLKGKRAVVKWLKLFRWKKKKEYERMTLEEKILFKLRKAHKKEERLVEAIQKIEPKDSSVTTHDPEVLTPEEHFYLLKLGQKCKNYVPVGRRGIFQGVILNMHLHWKKHQTLKVIVKTFTAEEVREIAAELARLSGGIVLDIDEDNTIIMYRGKNYSQPPTEIMSPKVTLTRKKALDKSKYRDALHAVRRYIPKLEQELEDLHTEMKSDSDYNLKSINREENSVADNIRRGDGLWIDNLERSGETNTKTSELDGSELERNMFNGNESSMDSETFSEPESLSDIFETDSEVGIEEKDESPLYLNEIERFPSKVVQEPEDFQEHLRQISAASKRGELDEKDLNVAELDDIDKIFLRADINRKAAAVELVMKD